MVSADLTRGTVTGGIFTAVAYSLLLLLLIAELGAYVRVSYSTNVVIDDQRAEAMRIEFDVSLFDLPCKYLKVGAWDKYGKDRLVSNNTFKYQPLDHKGSEKGSTYTEAEIAILEQADVANDLTEDEIKEIDADWSSSSDHFKHKDFQAAVTLHDFTLVNFYAEWCVHCRQFHPMWMQAKEKISEKMHFSDANGKVATVKFLKMNCVDFQDNCMKAKIQAFPSLRLYKKDGSFEVFQQKRTIENIIQFLTNSVRNSHFIVARHHMIFNEGCRVTGSIEVPRVPGHFHLQAEPFGSIEINPALTNVSHQVHHLSFGAVDSPKSMKERYSRLKKEQIPDDVLEHLMPLDGRTFSVDRFHEAPEHYLKVVSTKIEGKRLLYQMTHTGRTRKLSGRRKDKVPQARFMYDFSPMSVVVKSNSKRWYEFMTSLFAILGGTYTVMELCSGAVETTTTIMKETLGKDK
jgi:thiol-disulfide isomerase/thioredoxin